MEHVHIAALRPTLDALDSKQIKAVVTLIWPYSSSQRQFALLLAEPDFRLRRRNGQVRARFSQTSARALAATGVGIGDEVVLSLHGAQFVHDGLASTPGKSIDWELAYTQTVAISVRRHGAEIAHLELLDAAPTPAPRSPVKRPAPAPSPVPQWSSPAFLKRARLSDGPLFQQPAYDPLADESYHGHDKKRRRKSYRDWTAWTYAARTPSPDKEDAGSEDELEEALSSPSRLPQLPKTPLSPSRTEHAPAVAGPVDGSEYVEETTIADSAEGDTTVDDGELRKVHVPLSMSPVRPQGNISHDGDYYQLYDGPNEAPTDSQYDFGGDTELNTEDEDEDEEDVTVPDVEGVDASTTEAATELEDEPEHADDTSAPITSQPVAETTSTVRLDAASATEEDSDLEIIDTNHSEDISVEVEGTTIDETVPEIIEPASAAMPPPSLPALDTEFTNTRTDLLTPIGREPSSPNLKAVDSATLPLPSPFPGEQVTSYFEHVSSQQQVPLDGPPVQEELEATDADYIMESSFFSSINSSRAGGLHPDHETAFTPLRFTFGMDGAGWSRPLELSSPPPEDASVDAVDGKHARAASPMLTAGETKQHHGLPMPEESQIGRKVIESPEDSAHMPRPLEDTTNQHMDIAQDPVEAFPTETTDPDPAPNSSNVILLSSDVESDHSEHEDEARDDFEEEQASEEENESGSEDKVEYSNEEHESESEDDDVIAEQRGPDSSQLQMVPDNKTDVDSASEAERPYHTKDMSVSVQASAAVPEVVGMGLPSASETNEDDETEDVDQQHLAQAVNDTNATKPQDRVGDTGRVHRGSSSLEVGLRDEPASEHAPEGFDEIVGMDIVQERIAPASPGTEPTAFEPASLVVPDTHKEPLNVALGDDLGPQLGMKEPSPFIEEHDLPDARAETLDIDTGTEHPDIKMDSVEDNSLYLHSQPQTHHTTQEPGTNPISEVVMSFPENEHKAGELQSSSVPASAPARNTRSKAKSAASPQEEEGHASIVSTSTRRTRSKASFDSSIRDTTSPTRTRRHSKSTASPIRDGTQTSPYSLRSQSKHLSPDSVASQPAPVHTSPRQPARRDIDHEVVSSQAEERNLLGSMSQEPAVGESQLSQGRYSDVGYTKHSAEGALHTQGSTSTTQDSGSVEIVDEPPKPRLKPPPLSFSQAQRQTRSTSRSIREQSENVSPSFSQFSPRRSPRLTRSALSPSSSPRLARTTRDPIQTFTTDVIDKDERQEKTQRSDQQSILYPGLPVEGEDDIRRFPPATLGAAQQPLQHESNLPTPGDTQQTALEPPLPFQARQPEQSFGTLDSTQTTSASATLRSFDIALPGMQTQPAPPSPTLRTSPRHKFALTKATPSSPVHQTSSAISSPISTTAIAQNSRPLPTIGLSTPLAYYTPLRDLPFFLNRSSQFHSGSSPDILALVVSPTKAPVRAKRGPRDYSTTLRIADLSVYPESRTVNIFRPHAAALPGAETGDVVLLRAFEVHSQARKPALRSGAESAWCVWRFGRTVWGKKRGVYAELKAREEVKGPEVERGPGEWGEVERIRDWWLASVQRDLEKRDSGQDGEKKGKREVGSQSKGVEVQVEELKGNE